MKLLTDPNIFNYVILTLFAANFLRQVVNSNPQQVIYWAGAVIIQISLTFKWSTV